MLAIRSYNISLWCEFWLKKSSKNQFKNVLFEMNRSQRLKRTAAIHFHRYGPLAWLKVINKRCKIVCEWTDLLLVSWCCCSHQRNTSSRLWKPAKPLQTGAYRIGLENGLQGLLTQKSVLWTLLLAWRHIVVLIVYSMSNYCMYLMVVAEAVAFILNKGCVILYY